MQQAFIGIDVGTGSARAGIFDERGTLLATARRAIAIWHEAGDIVEQSSDDIWAACVSSVQEAMQTAGIAQQAIRGIGFDATCSLVALDKSAQALTVSPSANAARNVIVWMDHRATAEARWISDSGHEVLRYVGGIISPEMQTPKILWLKKQLPASYHAAGHFFDLADYLTFRATGSMARSICTVTCKWTYLAHERRWNDDYFQRIGLPELCEDDHARIGREIVEPGTPLGKGLTAKAAAEFGLLPGTPVGASLIDAHAGGIGTVGGQINGGEAVNNRDRLAYIMGTSACIMASTAEAHFVKGVWGPYFSAMIPGLWLNEGGQSAAGAGIDHLVRGHPAFSEAESAAAQAGLGILEYLEQRVIARSATLAESALSARHLHVLPEFLGNRSPYADPDARAVLAGLNLDSDLASLEALFVAGLCGLAYGLADVVEAMRQQSIAASMMVISGGASRSALVRQIMADTTGMSVALPATTEPVLLGAAMLGAVAGQAYASIPAAMESMSAIGDVTDPSGEASADFHRAKRRVHGLMQRLDRDARATMGEWSSAHGGRQLIPPAV